MNKRILIDGVIPAGTVCPYLEKCEARVDRCPSEESLKTINYSCAAARAFASLPEELVKKLLSGIKNVKSE